MKSTSTFKVLLIDLCKKVFKQLKEKNSSYESKLIALNPKVTSTHLNFAKFFLKMKLYFVKKIIIQIIKKYMFLICY